MNKEKIKKWLKKDIRKLTLDEYYIVLAYLAGGTFIVVFAFLIGSLFTFNIDNIVKLLVPFGVLLSAGLASASVMKSIENTNKIELKKEENNNRNTKNKIKIYLNLINSHMYMYSVDFNSLLDDDLILKSFIKKQIEYLEILIKDKDIMSLGDNDILKIMGYIEMNIDISEQCLNSGIVPIEELKILLKRNYENINKLKKDIKENYKI